MQLGLNNRQMKVFFAKCYSWLFKKIVAFLREKILAYYLLQLHQLVERLIINEFARFYHFMLRLALYYSLPNNLFRERRIRKVSRIRILIVGVKTLIEHCEEF